MGDSIKPRGIVGHLLKEAKLTPFGKWEIPSIDFCELCQDKKQKGKIRYFVAVPLPQIMHLCDDHYAKLRNELKIKLHYLIRKIKEEK